MPFRTTTRLVLTTALSSLLLVGCGGGEPPGADTPTTTMGNPAGQALAYQVPGMTKIAAATEAYSEAEGLPLEMDLYRPPVERRAPVVLLLHGVTPDASPKDFAGLVGWGQALATSGVAAAVINYRADESGKGVGRDDVEAAIEHLRRDERVDMSRWGLLTFSAGGPYGVRVAASSPRGMAAVGFFYARTEPSDGSPTPATSLATLATKRPDLPVFAAYGALDSLTGIAESQRRLQRAVGRHGSGRVTVLVHPTAGHGFDISGDGDSSAIVRSAVEFFAEELGG
jgi:dienelactone hydrolase